MTPLKKISVSDVASASGPSIAVTLFAAQKSYKNSLCGDNNFDQPMIIMIGGVDAMYLRPGQSKIVDFTADEATINPSLLVQAYYPGTAPASGFDGTAGDLVADCVS